MNRLVCASCISPTILKTWVHAKGSLGVCSFCGVSGASLPADDLYRYLWDRIRENTASINDLSEYEEAMIYECGADDVEVATIDVVLAEWLGLNNDPYIDDAIANLPEDLRKDELGNERHFFRDDGGLERNIYADRWQEFVRKISHVHRFFNKDAAEFLDSVFSGMIDSSGGISEACLLKLSPGTALYRARKVDSFAKAKLLIEQPHAEFGPTPAALAGSQRMTPNGISALYCALDRDTCLSEIRSITGDSVVSVALTPTESMAFLDISKLDASFDEPRSMLEIGYLEQMHLKSFIRGLVGKMSQPKRSGDELGYLSTQVVFEYLRLRLACAAHGVAFPSVQTGSKGVNVAVFPEHCSILEVGKPSSSADRVASLQVVDGSFVFHKVTAITTDARTYMDAHHLFMEELTRRRLGDLTSEEWRSSDKRMQYSQENSPHKNPVTSRSNRFLRRNPTG